jgi:hypothetical protein
MHPIIDTWVHTKPSKIHLPELNYNHYCDVVAPSAQMSRQEFFSFHTDKWNLTTPGLIDHLNSKYKYATYSAKGRPATSTIDFETSKELFRFNLHFHCKLPAYCAWAPPSWPLITLFEDMPIFIWNVQPAVHAVCIEKLKELLKVSVKEFTRQDIDALYAIIYSRLSYLNVDVSCAQPPEFTLRYHEPEPIGDLDLTLVSRDFI